MTTPTFAEQAASLITSTFKDGEPSDGTPTEEEAAAAAANAPKVASREEAEEEGGDVEAPADVDDADTKSDDPPDTKSDDPPDTKSDDPPDTKSETAPGESKKPGKKTYNERIGDLTAARRQAERDAEALRAENARVTAELEALKSGAAPLTGAQSDDKSGEGAPDPSKFDYGELDPKYIAALARFETAQALKAQRAEDDKTRQAAAADAKRQEVAEKQDKLVKVGVQLHDDFDEVVMQGAREGKWDLSPTLGELILDSEHGPAIAYALASDPDESRRVAKLSAAQQAAYFGRQEAAIEAAKPSQRAAPKTPQAPPPPKTPRGGNGSNKVGADSSDFAAVEAAWRTGALT